MDLALTKITAARLPALQALTAPAIRLHPLDPAGPLVLGQTRFGGRPDWPRGLPWPRYRNTTMDFLLQVDLASLAGLPGADELPARGRLYFFYTAYGDAWGVDREQAGAYVVMHLIHAPHELSPEWKPADFDLDASFPVHTARPATHWTIPSSNSDTFSELKLDEPARERYFALESELVDYYATDSGASWLLGHAAQFQGIDLAGLCEENGPSGEGPWRLLLQFCPPDGWELEGILYFFIREPDLAAGRFDRIWCVVED